MWKYRGIQVLRVRRRWCARSRRRNSTLNFFPNYHTDSLNGRYFRSYNTPNAKTLLTELFNSFVRTRRARSRGPTTRALAEEGNSWIVDILRHKVALLSRKHVHQILSESTGFCRRYDKNILVCFFGSQCSLYVFNFFAFMYQLVCVLRA